MARNGRRLSVLGSTGSIGTSTLDVVRRFPDRFSIVALAAGTRVDLLARQVAEFSPRLVAVKSEREARLLRPMLPPGCRAELVWEEDGLGRAAAMEEADTVVSALVGAVGLSPTLAAVRAGKRVALANKETLVMAGELVMAEARIHGAEILPVDSEHSAVFQSQAGQRRQDLRRVILTASGGPFLHHSADQLRAVTREDALRHPNWSMGQKITVDSATLMNKGLEAIEARWLFDLDWDRIAIQIHPQSIVHSMVEFVDGSVIAQLGVPDMRMPIAFALAYPERLPLDLPPLNLPTAPGLTFMEPDLNRFPCLALALAAGRRGGLCPAVLNAANEEAVAAFLDGRLSYSGIAEVVAAALNSEGATSPRPALADVFTADDRARQAARAFIDRKFGGR